MTGFPNVAQTSWCFASSDRFSSVRRALQVVFAALEAQFLSLIHFGSPRLFLRGDDTTVSDIKAPFCHFCCENIRWLRCHSDYSWWSDRLDFQHSVLVTVARVQGMLMGLEQCQRPHILGGDDIICLNCLQSGASLMRTFLRFPICLIGYLLNDFKRNSC